MFTTRPVSDSNKGTEDPETYNVSMKVFVNDAPFADIRSDIGSLSLPFGFSSRIFVWPFWGQGAQWVCSEIYGKLQYAEGY